MPTVDDRARRGSARRASTRATSSASTSASTSSRPTTSAGATRASPATSAPRAGRDLNHPMTQGLQALPEIEAEALLASATTCSRCGRARRACGSSAGLDEGERVPSVVSVWPTATGTSASSST